MANAKERKKEHNTGRNTEREEETPDPERPLLFNRFAKGTIL
jgi:hypothetical protein